jgi:hypothetical protein
MQHFLRHKRLFLALTLVAATPLFARFHTRQIGYLAEHAKESLGKSFWVDGCVNGQPTPGKIFQLQDGTGGIAVLAAGEAPPPGACMELNGVFRFQESAGVKQYVLEEKSRKIH